MHAVERRFNRTWCRHPIAVLLTLAYIANPGQVLGQTPRDSGLRSAIAAYDEGDFAGALNLIDRAGTSGNDGDMAIASLYRGLISFALGDSSRAGRHFRNATALEPRLELSSIHAPSRISAFTGVRDEVPLITSMAIEPSEFFPYRETTSISYVTESNPGAGGRDRARVTFEIGLSGTEEPAYIEARPEGRLFEWDGRLSGQIVLPGKYVYRLSAAATNVDYPTRFSQTVRIDVDAPYGTQLRPLPSSPHYLDETKDEKYTPTGTKILRVVTGLVTAGGLAVYATADPPCKENAASNGTLCAVGGTALVLGGLTFLGTLAVTKTHTVSIEENITRNAELRAAHERSLEATRRRNTRVQESVKVVQRPIK